MLRPASAFSTSAPAGAACCCGRPSTTACEAHGITLSKNQHAHVNALIEERGLQGRVRMELRDYRELPEDEPFDKIASIGMFEHVGRANLPRLLRQDPRAC